MFLLCTSKDGDAMAIAAERVFSIQEAPDSERQKDVRVCSVVTVIAGGTMRSIGVQESFETLMSSFGKPGQWKDSMN